MRLETVLFDLDGTLVDTAPDITRGLNQVLSAAGYPPFSQDEVVSMIGAGLTRLMERAFTRRGDPEAGLLADARADRFLQVTAGEPAAQSRVYEGVGEVLDVLKRAGHRLAVCTNKTERLAKAVLHELDLLDSFDAVLGAGSVAKKPAAEPVLEAIRRAGGQRTSAVMVGDSATDLEAARGAGVPCVLVTYGYHQGRLSELCPDAWANRFEDVPSALVHLGAAFPEAC